MDENWSRDIHQKRAIAETTVHEWRMKTLRPEAAQCWIDMINVIGEDKLRKIAMIMFIGRPEYFFSYEPPHTIVKKADLPKDNRTKLNAWRMLMHLKRTET